jgi:hypothetical protein
LRGGPTVSQNEATRSRNRGHLSPQDGLRPAKFGVLAHRNGTYRGVVVGHLARRAILPCGSRPAYGRWPLRLWLQAFLWASEPRIGHQCRPTKWETRCIFENGDEQPASPISAKASLQHGRAGIGFELRETESWCALRAPRRSRNSARACFRCATVVPASCAFSRPSRFGGGGLKLIRWRSRDLKDP